MKTTAAIFFGFLLASGGVIAACSSNNDGGGTSDQAVMENPDAGNSTGNQVAVQLLAINDFHGNLEAPAGGSGALYAHADDPYIQNIDAGAADAGLEPDSGNPEVSIRAGGAAYLATHIKQLRDQNPNTVVVSAGDLSGASPLLSSLFHDEPSVLAMNSLGLELNAVGNHELDHGPDALLRLQNGGCDPTSGCTMGVPTFPGASYHYLAANINNEMKQTLFRPYEIKTFDGEKIAFIGMTLEDTPGVVTADAIKGLTFGNEANTVSALLPEIKAQGVSGIVVLVHQGSFQDYGSTYDECGVSSGPIVDMAKALDPAVDIVVSAHTHQPYVCEFDGKLVTSASSFGRVVTKIDFTIDKTLHKIITKKAANLPVTQDVTPDYDVASIVSTYNTLSAPLANRVVGHITADLPASSVDFTIGESYLGDVIADAQLEATKSAGAVAAFMNPGGIRADLLNGQVTYAQAFAVQPFANLLVTEDVTGQNLKDALEAQYAADGTSKILQISNGVSYTFDPAAAIGSRISDVTINGAPLDLKATYRVTINNFVAGGGDGFAPFALGTNRVTGAIDLDALTAYLTAHDPLPMPAGGRIKKKM